MYIQYVEFLPITHYCLLLTFACSSDYTLVNYNPRRKDGFGLTDGEMLERLWSYLRPFGKMTKEMRPSHRTDVLTDALLHYGKQTLRKMGMYSLYYFMQLYGEQTYNIS